MLSLSMYVCRHRRYTYVVKQGKRGFARVAFVSKRQRVTGVPDKPLRKGNPQKPDGPGKWRAVSKAGEAVKEKS